MKLHYPNNIVDISIMRNGVDKTKFLFKPGLKEEKTEMYDFTASKVDGENFVLYIRQYEKSLQECDALFPYFPRYVFEEMLIHFHNNNKILSHRRDFLISKSFLTKITDICFDTKNDKWVTCFDAPAYAYDGVNSLSPYPIRQVVRCDKAHSHFQIDLSYFHEDVETYLLQQRASLHGL